MNRRFLLLTVLAIGVTATAWAQNSGASPRAGQPRNTFDILNQRIPEVEFVNQPLDSVIEWLGDLTQLNIVVRWQTLADAGIERDTQISIKVRNLRLSQVLWLIMNEVGHGELELAYRASGSLLVLSTETDLGKEQVTKVYDVSDLLITIPRAQRRSSFDVTQGMGQGRSSGGGGGGSGSGMFQQGSQNQNQEDPNNQTGASAVAMQQLIDLIMDTVEPDSWAAKGGGNGTIHAFGRLLVIRNTILVHQRLGGYLSEDEVSGP